MATQYWFISWSIESHTDTLSNGSNYGYLGAAQFSRGKKKNGDPKKNTRATYLYNAVKLGDYVICGNAPSGKAVAAILVEEKIPQDGKDNISLAEGVWPNDKYTATHKTRLIARCDGVDVSELKQQSAPTKRFPKGKLEFGINKGNGFKGKAGVVREISESDYVKMRNKINVAAKRVAPSLV